jgi:hypothetical protein
MLLLDGVDQVEVLVSSRDRCIICVKCTIGVEIILDAQDGTPR